MSASDPLQEIRTELADIINNDSALHVSAGDITRSEPGRGDMTLPCFQLAKAAGGSPIALATRIADRIRAANEPLIASVAAAGPYVNFFLDRISVAKRLSGELRTDYGKSEQYLGQKVVLEYVSPNTNKPLHLGHLRNACLGWSIAKLLEANGANVTKTEIINDRGIPIMKSLFAYQRFGNGATPELAGVKGDHFVGNYYVRFSEEAKKNEGLDGEAQDLLRRWEAGDAELKKLWQTMNGWAEDGQTQTCDRLGISFDHIDYESKIYEDGKRIVLEALAQGLARKRDDGAVVVDINEGEEKEKVLLRADGTSIYVTQDLALAKRRVTDFHPDRLLYVVAQEQDYHFRILFDLLAKLNVASKDKLQHISYHWVFLPDGRMKSREGTVVDTDDVLDELHALAAEEVRTRNPELTENEIGHRAEAIALAAAKYYMLRVRPDSDITFNPKESIAFTGDTGPYLLYTYARIQSIFRKTGEKIPPSFTNSPVEVSGNEWAVLMALATFPETLTASAQKNDPSLVANYTYELSKVINDFYEKEPVLKADEPIRRWRLELLAAAARTLSLSLDILGITTLDEM